MAQVTAICAALTVKYSGFIETAFVCSYTVFKGRFSFQETPLECNGMAWNYARDRERRQWLESKAMCQPGALSGN